MKILMIHPHDIFSAVEPWTRRVTSIASELAQRGHQVRLLYHSETPLPPEHASRVLGSPAYEAVSLNRFNRTLVSKCLHVARLAKWADVVHVQKCLPHAFLPAVFAAYVGGKPLHYDWDDWEYGIFMCEPMDRFLGSALGIFEHAAVRLADTVSVASEGIRQKCLNAGFRVDRIFLAPVGADLVRFHPSVSGAWVRDLHALRTPVVMYVGQICGAQHVVDFLRAIKILVERGVPASFVVVGGGDRLLRTRRLAATLGISDAVVFTDAVAPSLVPRYLAAADIAVAAFSDCEQQRCKSPLKVAEYMAAGKAVVASNVGEVPRFAGDCAILVPPADAEALADAIEDLIVHGDKRRAMGEKARRRAEEKLGWSVATDNLLQAYKVGLELRGKLDSSPTDSLTNKWLKPARARKKLHAFVRRNLDLVGIMDGETAFRGPEMVQIDLTNRCNNDCIGCWCRSPLLLDRRISGELEAQTLPTKRVFSLLEELASIGTTAIYYAGGGEPFMHPDIMPILEKTHALGLVCHVNTNFTLVDHERARALLDWPIDYLRISLWAATPEIYSATHPNQDGTTLERLHETIRCMVAERRDDGFPKIEIYHVINSLNCQEIEAMVDRAVELGVDGVEFALVDVIPGCTESLLIDGAQRKQVLTMCDRLHRRMNGSDRIGGLTLFRFDDFARRVACAGSVNGDYDADIIDSIPCTIGWTFSRILADGSVNGCLKAHRIPVGNIHDSAFSTIWNSEAQRRFRSETHVLKKDGPFFAMIGNDPGAAVGCHRGCDDFGRNVHTQKRLHELGWAKRQLLRGGLWSLR